MWFQGTPKGGFDTDRDAQPHVQEDMDALLTEGLDCCLQLGFEVRILAPNAAHPPAPPRHPKRVCLRISMNPGPAKGRPLQIVSCLGPCACGNTTGRPNNGSNLSSQLEVKQTIAQQIWATAKCATGSAEMCEHLPVQGRRIRPKATAETCPPALPPASAQGSMAVLREGNAASIIAPRRTQGITSAGRFPADRNLGFRQGSGGYRAKELCEPFWGGGGPLLTQKADSRQNVAKSCFAGGRSRRTISGSRRCISHPTDWQSCAGGDALST